MRNFATLLLAVLVAFSSRGARGAVLYVDVKSASPSPPYSDWSTAANNIQDAIDASSDGDLILVTNGVYATGGTVVYGSLTNRVAIDDAVTVESVNGPLVTVIEGYQDTNSVVGDDAVRCVYMTNGATLSGFTLTNGATRNGGDPVEEQSGGGVWGETTDASVTNCVMVGNSAAQQGGGAMQVTLTGCVFSNNVIPLSFIGPYAISAGSGGGAENCQLNNCLLVNNYAGDLGGGAAGGVLTNCVLAGNSVNDSGGAAGSATLLGCTLTNNTGGIGPGGAETCVLVSCTVAGNVGFYGGGMTDSSATNCTFIANSGNNGGGALNSTLVDCTLSNNLAFDSEAPGYGGAADGGSLVGCQLLNNFAAYGGGAESADLTNCTLASNTAEYNGGGGDNSVLVDCMLAGNVSGYSGGGAEGSTLNNCILTNNVTAPSSPSVQNASSFQPQLISPGFGGGADYSTLNNCLLLKNYAGDNGGGANSCTVNNCTFIGNSAPFGGGDCSSTVNNSILYYNAGDNNYGNDTLNYCCTTPDPGGVGNITNRPAFVNWTNSDFHLQSTSPCINSGDNFFVTVGNDLDGNPRIAGGTVDIGAYEYQTPTSIISYAWLQQYGLPMNGSEDHADLDGAGMNNWQKSIAGLSPTDPTSVLVMLPPLATNNTTNGVTVTWQSVPNRMYLLQRSCDLNTPAFSLIQGGIPGQTGTTTFTDTTATNAGPYFYQIGVQ